VREVPRQRVNVLLREEESVVSSTPRMQTFGANIDDLSQFFFLDGEISPRYRRRLAEWAREQDMNLDNLVETYGDQLSPVTLSLIARAMLEHDED
jgi:hypothetical protein